MTHYVVSSGQVASTIATGSNDFLTISSGGTALDPKVGSPYVVSSGGTVISGAFTYGSENYLYGTDSGSILYDDSLHVDGGGLAIGDTIYAGEIDVYAGGEIVDTNDHEVGITLHSGALAVNTNISANVLYVDAGAVASNTTVYGSSNGFFTGDMTMTSSGSTALNTTLDDGGRFFDTIGDVVSGLTVNAGGYAQLVGTVDDFVLNGGTYSVAAGTTINGFTFISGENYITGSAPPVLGSSTSSGGTTPPVSPTSGIYVSSGAVEYVSSGVVANNITLAPDNATVVAYTGATVTFVSGGAPALTANDGATGATVETSQQPYGQNGVTNLFIGQQEDSYLNMAIDPVKIVASTPSWLINTGYTGTGDNAITVSSGHNVVDAGTGSSFITGGTGADGATDSFFIDDLNPTNNIWSTAVNFHNGDDATVWGISQSDFNTYGTWTNSAGAVGFQGLTLTISKHGSVPDALVTLTGYSKADLTDGKLAITFGTETLNGVPNTDYMLITGTG